MPVYLDSQLCCVPRLAFVNNITADQLRDLIDSNVHYYRGAVVFQTGNQDVTIVDLQPILPRRIEPDIEDEC
jgi:hypothetical protein